MELATEHAELHEYRVLHTPVRVLDAFVGGLESSKLTAVQSTTNFVFDFVALLCVQAVKQFGEDVVLVDGGTSADPYAFSKLARRFGLSKEQVLSSISIARAFTAYQMVTIITESPERNWKKVEPVC